MTDPEKDYYAVLGVPETADTETIKRAYRQKAKALHPDRAGAESTAAFQELQAAYETLSDPRKRAEYDRRRRETRTDPPSPPPSGHSGGWSLYPDGCRRRGLYVGWLDVYCDPEERAHGTVLRLATRLDVPCRLCRAWFFGLPDCPACHGLGWTSRPVFLDLPITPAMYRRSYWHAERSLGEGLYLCLDLRLHAV